MNYADDIISCFKEEFHSEFMNEAWIVKQYKIIYENPRPDVKKILEDKIYKNSEIQLHILKDLYLRFTTQKEKDLKESEKLTYHKEHQNLDNSLLVNLPPINKDNKLLSYEQFIYNSLNQQPNLSSFINDACFKYETEDMINKLYVLIKASTKAEEYILNKYGKKYLDRIFFEDATIKYFQEEMHELNEYTLISNDPQTKCIYYEDEIKVHVTKEFNGCNIMKAISLLADKEGLKNWFPFFPEEGLLSKIINKLIPGLEKPSILKTYTKTKLIHAVQTEIPIIQDRELVLYSFIFNQLLERGKIFFFNRSVDGEELFNDEYTYKSNEDKERLFAHCIVFELSIIDENKIIISLFVDLFHKLKFNDVQLVEVMVKQFMKKVFEKISNTITSESKLKPNIELKEVLKYYSALVDKYLNILETDKMFKKQIEVDNKQDLHNVSSSSNENDESQEKESMNSEQSDFNKSKDENKVNLNISALNVNQSDVNQEKDKSLSNQDNKL